MSKHSSIVGGSNAGRLVNCPASHQTLLALPPAAEISSQYAEEGTAMHAAMDWLMRARADCDNDMLLTAPRDTIGTTFHDRALTQAHVDTMIAPALAYLAHLEEIYGGGFEVLGVEQRVKFPRVAGAFGTIDLVLQSRDYVLHVDWKFGQGVGVQMVYSDGEGAVVNPQLLFYIAAARATKPAWYAGGRKIVGAIIQPRGIEPLTHTEITRKEIRQFVEDVENAVLAAIGRDPPRARGEHCRFAPCKVICPLWTGPMLDLSALKGPPTPARELNVNPHRVSSYGAYLAKAKALADLAEMFKKSVDEQLHAYLGQGGIVPGWRLKAKTKMRQWIDEETVERELSKLGLTPDDIFQVKLQTFQHVDAAARRLGVKIPDHLRVAPPSTETTIARTNDPAPVVEPHAVAEQFSATLRQLIAEKPAN